MEETKMCRICLSETGETFRALFALIQLEGPEKTALSICEMICSFSAVQIALNDGLPGQICTSCSEQVVAIYLFKTQLENNDKILRKRLIDEDRVVTITGSKNDLKLGKKDLILRRRKITKAEKPKSENVNPANECERTNLNEGIEVKCERIDLHEEPLSDQYNNPAIKPDEHRKTQKFNSDNLMENQHLITDELLELKDEYFCDHCSKMFKTKQGLKKHLLRIKNMVKTKKSSTRKPYACEICLKSFRQISNLKDHMRTHNGEKPYLCATCGKGFNQLGNLRQHQVRHSGVKSHICTICGHGFASKGELHTHHRKHTGARPFVCDSCGKGFTTSSSLIKHKRIHSGEKPYECEYCKLKFSRSGILSRHRRIHTGEKPYVCEICKKAFTQSNDLNSHLRIHTGEKPYKCSECGQLFRQNSALKSHKKTHQRPKAENGKVVYKKRHKEEVFVEDEENILALKFTEVPSSI
ncbi:zinc finger protein 678-like [Euwallacea similis]|uniref:zinc finger protein 678-like n=1 Tax=Euwallacea similis TaxID=1736056 RepID=UPI00344F9C43